VNDIDPIVKARATKAAEAALRQVCIELPHLSGLARSVRLRLDERVETAGVFASGRLLVNPTFVLRLSAADAAFVMAHELLHLALLHHERSEGSDALASNFAEDFIINDMLKETLGRPGPTGILVMDGARDASVERLLLQLRRKPESMPQKWLEPDAGARGKRGGIGDRAGRSSPSPSPSDGRPRGDVLGEALEREWFPGETEHGRRTQLERMREEALRAATLEILEYRTPGRLGETEGSEHEHQSRLVRSLRAELSPAWEGAVQRWLDEAVPAPRSYARPSRRSVEGSSVVLPGRHREGWTIHFLLDSSGSMWPHLPAALGAMAHMCEAAGVDRVRVIQCDSAITFDAFLEPTDLESFAIVGLGGLEGLQVPPEEVPPEPEPEQPSAEPQREPEPVRPPEPAREPVRTWDYRPYQETVHSDEPYSSRRPPTDGAIHSPDYFAADRGKRPYWWHRPRRRTDRRVAPIDRSGREFQFRMEPAPASPPRFVQDPTGSDLSPALLRLMEEPDVQAVVVVTDGKVRLPADEPGFEVLWLVTDAESAFEPPYGFKLISSE